jgi:hypothetical protein
MIIGFFVGALVYRNNKTRIEGTVDAVSKAADEIKKV